MTRRPRPEATPAVSELLFQMRVAKLPRPETEWRFHPVRLWRFDLALTERKVAVEVDGGTFLPKGRHTTGVGYAKDCEKLNEAAILGWRVLRVTPAHIRSGEALIWIEQLLK